LQEDDPETGLTIDPPSSLPGPDALIMNEERIAQVRAAVDELGEPCREIIELRYFADLSYEDISAALDLNPKTVSSRLSKCLDRLEEIARPLFQGANEGVFPSKH
jgi:RNA polymerase sigma-70 factor (ECF subfamily)